MNFRLCTGLAALACLAMASCYPYNENQNRKKPVQGMEKKVTPEEQAKLKEKEAKKKAEAEIKKKSEEAKPSAPTETPGANTQPPAEKPAPPSEGSKPTTEVKKPSYPVAAKVPGKEGYVFSPYNTKVVEVRDEQGKLIPSGTLVQDPTFPASEKKYFRVP